MDWWDCPFSHQLPLGLEGLGPFSPPSTLWTGETQSFQHPGTFGLAGLSPFGPQVLCRLAGLNPFGPQLPWRLERYWGLVGHISFELLVPLGQTKIFLF